MKVKYNKETQYLSYQIGEGEDAGYSGFKVSAEAVKEISPEVYSYEGEGFLEIPQKLYSAIYDAFRSERFRTIKIDSRNFDGKITVDIDRDADPKVVATVVEAYQKKQPLYVRYEAGWEYYPSEEEDESALYSDDGRVHIVYPGVSTGEKKIFLAVEKDQFGGMSFNFSGISEIKTDAKETKLVKELLKYERLQAKKEVRDALKNSGSTGPKQ